ncbi:MAG: hypothetical protein IT368_02785, partial [Candidatus Hydrogenedentes bacterium]|nr:hypothetical protein [Candidatus Hydrogenedentota bacterium]
MRRMTGASALFLLLALAVSPSFAKAPAPIALHPDNPHYFLWRDEPTVLITSGEHYGAVLNLDFDYARYLGALQKDGLNLTRTFSGSYVELPHNFGITDNTLAPEVPRYITPWARSAEAGTNDRGAKFDLTKWDSAYFERLKDYMTKASEAGVVVEFTIFCTLYEDPLWAASPMNAANNINGVGDCPRQEVHKLMHDDLTEVQVALTRKIVQELKGFDNLIYEVCNEPYIDDTVSMEFQHRIVDTIVEEETKLGVRHLISMNIANKEGRVEAPHPEVQVLQFHYAHTEAVTENYGHNRVIGDNETGFEGKEDFPYRIEAWDFILAGGALFNNLDYSFTAKHPEGDFMAFESPGGGGPAIRKQISTLKQFIESFNFVKMQPALGLISGVSKPVRAQALAEPGVAYAVYVRM